VDNQAGDRGTHIAALLEAARALHAAGCSVIPARPDGTKAPAANWKQYTRQRPSLDQLTTWLTFGGHDGIGVITGQVSAPDGSYLEMLELEGRALAEGVLQHLAQALDDHGLSELWARIRGGYLEATPSGGLHILYRAAGEPRGNSKLARRPARQDELTPEEQQILAAHPGKVFPRVLIETRGEGGYVVVAPSAGRTHQTGKPWVLLAGGPTTIATISEEERDALHAIASLLDTMPAAQPPSEPGPRPAVGQDHEDGRLRPGDDYNNRADWADILAGHFTPVAGYGKGRTWRRTGKNRGISATTGTRGEGDNLYVFSTSTEFDTETPYTKFGAYALLEHGGDHAAAARHLRRQGYGDPLPHDDQNIGPDLIAGYNKATHGPFPQGGGVDGNLATVHQLHPAPPPRAADDGRPRLDITHEDDAIKSIIETITTGVIPDLYVRLGDISQVLEIDDGTGPRLVIRTVDADNLRQLLAHHTACYKTKKTADGYVETAALPAVATARAALTPANWPGVRHLAGVTAFPFIRPTGTINHHPGYDPETRLYHQPAYPTHPAPENPTPTDIAHARKFLLDHVLADFCWDSDASKANYIALLLTPLLRLYIRGLPPLGIISATTRGSGKTLLTEVLDAIYTARLKPWPKRDEECTKVITATLISDTAPVISFDNVGPFDSIDHPSLAALLTTTQWTDRVLGSSANVTATNDRLWLANGNNVAIGGDIASRSILVGLDPKTERPEERGGFQIDDLWAWLKTDTNRTDLLLALHILARAWIAAGAPKDTTLRVRNFTTWAQAMAGLTAFHGINGFMENKDALAAGDDEETETQAFLAAWHRKFGALPKTAAELVESARGDTIGFTWVDPWDDTFPCRPDGKPFTAKGLGHYLKARRGRIFGGLTLLGDYDRKAKVWHYAVQPAEHSESGAL
jgi:hypothetical protein